MRHLVLAVVVLSVIAGTAAAQSKTIAEQLFNDARELAKAGRWGEACPKFEASFKQDPALGTRLNLATCYEHTGRLASAWGLYREAAELAAKAGDAKRSDYAQKQALVLEPRIPKLAITPPSTLPAGFAVRRDGLPVSVAELGLALYGDPGVHEVVALAPGFEPFAQKITLVEGKTETLAIPDLVAKAARIEPRAPLAAHVAEAPRVSATRKYIAAGVGGAGLVAVGVSLVLGSQAMSASNDAKQLCGDELACSAANFEAGKKLIEDGRSKARISTVLAVAGGAAIAAGVVLYVTAPRAKERGTTARLFPVIDTTGAGIGIAGKF